MLGPIEKRLRASLRFDAIHGDNFERSVCGQQMDEAAGEIDRLKSMNAELLAALKDMVKAYVSLLEIGRDRIIYLGGGCDPVEVMESSSHDLRKAKAAIQKAEAK